MDHATKECEVAYFHGQATDTYAYVWMVPGSLFSWYNTLKPVSDIEQMYGSLFSWKTSWLLSHAIKECQVANVHGQAADAYAAYVWMVQCSLFSWITLWNLCHTLKRCTVAYFHGKRHATPIPYKYLFF